MNFRRGAIYLLLVLLAACQAAPDGLTGTPSASATKTPRPKPTPDARAQLAVPKEALKGVTIQVWHPWFGVESSLFESQIKEFNQSNEWGIVAQPTSQNNYTQLYENVTAALPTPNRPQVVIAFPDHALGWDADGYVTDLTDYINDSEFGFGNDEIKDFPLVFWNQDSVGTKQLGVPAERSARFLLYDVTWAQQLGFDAAPANSTEFHTQACAAHQTMLSDTDKKNDGQGGWLVDTDSMTALSWMMAFGGGVLEGNDYRFLTPRNIAAFTFVKQLYDDGCAWSASPDADLPSAFANRKALFATASLEDLPDYARAMGASANADEWTVLSFPGNVQTGLVAYGSSYIVLKSTPEEQLASWLFIRWMLSPENQKKWVEVTGLFPLRNSSIDLLSDYKNSHPQWAAAVNLLPQAQIQPQLASWQKVRVMIGDGFSYMFRPELENQPITISNQPVVILQQMDTIAKDLSK
ncbi:MAG TPA: extracellular solute-binding protein [Anaerolineales bacterium]|nr:extracellular solute-binding protein [Anaerolineales bacterium]